jgi:hypothetical protein
MKTKGVQIAMKNLKHQSTACPKKTTLRFTPTAWSKLLFLRDAGDTEIGGFAIAAADDLLLVEDIRLVRQECSWAHVEFDDEAVAEFFDSEVDAGRRPEQFARGWIHTHPGDSPAPSNTDELTFGRVFGRSDWAVMFILAQGGQTYARLRFNVGPGGEQLIPVEVDYSRPFASSDFEAWQKEYLAHVQVPAAEPAISVSRSFSTPESESDDLVDGGWRDVWHRYTDIDPLTTEEPYGYIRDF